MCRYMYIVRWWKEYNVLQKLPPFILSFICYFSFISLALFLYVFIKLFAVKWAILGQILKYFIINKSKIWRNWKSWCSPKKNDFTCVQFWFVVYIRSFIYYQCSIAIKTFLFSIEILENEIKSTFLFNLLIKEYLWIEICIKWYNK